MLNVEIYLDNKNLENTIIQDFKTFKWDKIQVMIFLRHYFHKGKHNI